MAEHIVYFSDPITISSAPKNTRLIKYSNAKNYAGLNYSAGEIFWLRLVAKFYQQQEIEESESEDIPDGQVVALSNTIKNQKYFEVEPVPFYMIKKLKRIFRHNTISIDGDLWINEGSLDSPQMDERYPFYLGKIWLTKQNSFISNVFGDFTTIP